MVGEASEENEENDELLTEASQQFENGFKFQ